jgi:hypothetical protein
MTISCTQNSFKRNARIIRNTQCGWFGNMMPEERNKIFPFNEAEKILMISYPNLYIDPDFGWSEPIDSAKLANIEVKNKRKIIAQYHFSFETRSSERRYYAYEVCNLSPSGIDSLSNILFNFKVKKYPKSVSIGVMGCNTPRNAILFFNKNNDVIANIEISFQCWHVVPKPNEFDIPDLSELCAEKYRVLKEFFITHNIHVGTDY